MDARLELDVKGPIIKDHGKELVQILQNVPIIKPHIVLKMWVTNSDQNSQRRFTLLSRKTKELSPEEGQHT